MHAIKSDYYRLWMEVLNAADIVVELRETNNTLLSTRQSEIMKQLSVIAFIALPIGLGLTIFQIDTVSRPIVGKPGDFYVILLGAAALAMVSGGTKELTTTIADHLSSATIKTTF